MDGYKWFYAPLLLVAGFFQRLFKRELKLSRGEVEAMVDGWGADWLTTRKREAVDDIMWMIERR